MRASTPLVMEWTVRAAVVFVMTSVIAGLPSSYKDNLIDSDLNRTVEEVVGILGNRPDLPRLTRGEILELVADVRKQKSLDDKKKNNEPLVVVMPFRPNGTSIEELFTKAPVTQVVGDLASKLATKRPGYKRRRKPIPRPVYVPPESTSETNGPTITISVTTPMSPVSNIHKVPQRTTLPSSTEPLTRPSTTEKPWMPLDELAIPEHLRDPIEEISVKPSSPKPFFITIPVTKPTSKPAIPPEDVSVAAESLSPEMKDLLATFGLLGNDQNNKPEIKPVKEQPKDPYAGFEFGAVKPKVDPNSYIGFKPLPDRSDDSMSEDMKNFLASFGLINERTGKSIKPETSGKQKRSKSRDDKMLKVPKINSEMFSDDMMSVLENLGIANKESERKSKRLIGEHIFNPAQHTATLSKTDQLGKVQQLVSKIRELSKNHEIHSLTPTELKELLKNEADFIQLGEDGNLLVKTDSLDNNGGPDPLSLDEIVELFDKNESKREDTSEANDSKTNQTLTISTRRYDNEDDIIRTDDPEDSTEESSEEDSTSQQTTVSVVTTSPLPESSTKSERLELSANSSESASSTSSSGSMSSSSANSSASATSTGDSSSSSASGTSSAASSAASSSSDSSDKSSNDERSSSSATSSSSASSDANTASASASASSSSDGTAESTSSSSDNQPAADEGPSFDDLNDSFGGEVTTTPRPNGLFFLLDWNSFLQVGTDERKVDLSFNPKIGDPKNFYPIKFP